MVCNFPISSLGGLANPAYVRDLYDDDDDFYADDADGPAHNEPTEAEKTLPWKRGADEPQMICEAPVKQREFPAWLKNEEYMVHGAPSNEIIGVAGKNYIFIVSLRIVI